MSLLMVTLHYQVYLLVLPLHYVSIILLMLIIVYYISHIHIASPSVSNFAVIDRSSSNITLEWSPPNVIAPQYFKIKFRCHRKCDSSILKEGTFNDVLSPHQVTGVDPYSSCGFDLIGVYGSEIQFLVTNHLGSTLSAGKQ